MLIADAALRAGTAERISIAPSQIMVAAT